MMFNIITLVLSFSSYVLCATYDRIENIPNIDWDFIVVGAGPGGSVVANRLTENPNFNVLLVESGPTNEGVLDSTVPGLFGELGMSIYDWNYTTTSQRGLNGRSVTLQRGHMLGGSTSVNAMFYTRGSSSDYDRYARVTGDPGWSWDSLQPYIRKNERLETPADNHDTSGKFNPSVHSFDGRIPITLSSIFHPDVDNVTLQASRELGDEFRFNVDVNSGNPLGFGWLQTTIGHNGERSSAAVGYLNANDRQRKNLHIVTNTRVTRVLKTESRGRKLTVRTIEIRSPTSSSRTLLTAKKEVILSAGAIGTPHILLNSGIGDRRHLQYLNISTLLHNPDVGNNLHDHPRIDINWELVPDAIDPGPWVNQVTDPAIEELALQLWINNRTGPYTSSRFNQLAFLRIPNMMNFPDPSSGPNSPHIEMLFTILDEGSYLTSFRVVSPASRGSITLQSNNPFDQPLIDLGFFTNETDIFVAREGVKIATRFVSTPIFRGRIAGVLGPLGNATTEAEISDVIRNSARSALHPVGTTAMSARDSSSGVVDPDLLVKGVKGLRIVDASVLPFVPSANTQAPVYIIAERAADIIKAAWK